jgi:hypothetical protein
MIQYTERLTDLMHDIVSRVPALSFIDMRDVLVFARFGRSGYSGPVATCHCLNLADSDPGYYYWRDGRTGRITRRSEWFTYRSPVVTIADHRVKYLISFALPRFCDQVLSGSRKERFYGRAAGSWIAKLDTVVHELYHIDPDHNGIRRLERADGERSSTAHTPRFFEQVASMVGEYLDSRPNAATYAFLRHDFDTLATVHGGVTGTTFSPFPSYPQRFLQRLDPQPASIDPSLAHVDVEPWRVAARRANFTADHLEVRQFLGHTSRRAATGRQTRAA